MSEEQARDEGIERALGGAPVGWQVDAVAAVKLVAERRSYLSADDVWDQLERMGARTPPNRGALAGVLKYASGKRVAWIEPTDQSKKSTGDGRHASRIMVWRSLICGSVQARAWSDVFAPTATQQALGGSTTPLGSLSQRREADQGRRSGRG